MLKQIIKIISYIMMILGFSIPLGYKEIEIKENKENMASIKESEVKNNYFAILEIPKINLKQELFPINSSQNNVNKHLYVHKESIFPQENNSNVIIAGHSGSSKIAYFKNLYQVTIGDLIYLYYNNKLYTYEVKEIEYQNKTGTLYIKKDYDNELTLITCTKNDDTHQTIYYSNLIAKKNL